MAGITRIQNSTHLYHVNLNRFFRKNTGYKTYQKFIEGDNSAIVGNIPSEIIKLFDKNQRPKKIKQFQEAFAKLAQYMMDFKGGSTDFRLSLNKAIESHQQLKAEKSTEFFNELLKDIIPNVRAKIEYTDYGAFKDVYKFSLTDNAGKKIMHDKAFSLFRNSEYLKCITKHGLFAETNLWTFLKYRLGHSLAKTQFTKHYITDLRNKYMITEFADKDITKTTNKFDLYKLFGLVYTDTQYNPQICGKIYDIGGVSKTDKFIDDKVVFRYYKKILNRNTDKERKELISNLEKLVQNPKTPHRHKILKAIDLYNKRN